MLSRERVKAILVDESVGMVAELDRFDGFNEATVEWRAEKIRTAIGRVAVCGGLRRHAEGMRADEFRQYWRRTFAPILRRMVADLRPS